MREERNQQKPNNENPKTHQGSELFDEEATKKMGGRSISNGRSETLRDPDDGAKQQNPLRFFPLRLRAIVSY